MLIYITVTSTSHTADFCLNATLQQNTVLPSGMTRVLCVESCPKTQLADDRLLQLHSTDNSTVTQLTDEVMKALAKYCNYC